MKNNISSDTKESSLFSSPIIQPEQLCITSQNCQSFSINSDQDDFDDDVPISEQIISWLKERQIYQGNPQEIIEEFEKKQRDSVNSSQNQSFTKSLDLKKSALLLKRLVKKNSCKANEQK